MSSNIFKSEASKYWKRSLPVVPIEPGTKRPALKGWQGNLGAIPSEETQKAWLERYQNYGLGVLTGGEVVEGGTLIALDADDDRLVTPLLKFLGCNRKQQRGIVSGKKGKKGATFFILVSVADRIKSTVFKGTDGLGNIDLLAAGKQTVMPPTIHPETDAPYADVETPLLEVAFDQLPLLEKMELAVLKVAVGSEYILAIMDGKATHDHGVALTGQLVAAGATDEMITAIFSAFLPDGYSGNTLSELPGWISSAREKGFEKSGGGNSESLAAALIALALNSGAEFFNDGAETAYATVPTEKGRRTVSVMSGAFRRWLRYRAHVTFEKPLASSGPLHEAASTLEGIALFDGPANPVFTRIGGDFDTVELDLGRPDGQVVKIMANGWSVEPTSMHKLVRGAGFASLPNPRKHGSLRPLQDLLGLDDTTYGLVVAFLLNAMKPDGPFFALLVEGEQGSGKSFLTQIIKRILDPNKAERIRLPDNDRDLMIQAKEYRLLNFDNASGMKADISDALCSLSTGGGIAVRKLYTDGDLNVLSYARPFVINGISNFANRPDLMERAIPLRLPPMPTNARREERELWATFEEILPDLLGALCDAVSQSLRDRNQVTPPRSLRMADAARWIMAGAASLDLDPDGIIHTIVTAQDDLFIERINDEPLMLTIRQRIAGKPFEGHVGELFALLDHGASPLLPRSPSQLSKALDRLRPAMARAGVKVEFLGKDKRGRLIRVEADPKGPPSTFGKE